MRCNKVGLLAIAGVMVLPGAISALDRHSEIPFKMYRGYAIIVQGSIGQLRKRNILIDTGAVPSVLDRRVAKKLGLTGRPEEVSIFTQSVSAQRVVLSSLRLGPIRAEAVSMIIRDLSFIEEGLGVRVDAMVGFDVLGRSDFSIDYEAKTISFEHSGDPPESPDSAVPYQDGPGFMIVTMDVQGQPLRLMVDTGTRNLNLFQDRLRGRLPPLRVLDDDTTTNMAGRVRTQKVELPEARLGRREFGKLKAYIMDAPTDPRIDFEGLLGIVSLGFRRVGFDFEHQTISLAK